MSLQPWIRVALGLAPALIGFAPLACSGDDKGGVDAGMTDDAGDDGGADANTEPPVAGVVAAGVRWFGRVDVTTDPAHPRFAWSGTGFVAAFQGTSLTAQIKNDNPFIFKTVIDGTPQATFTSGTAAAAYPLAMGLAAGTHKVELYRQTEGAQGTSQLMGLTVGDGTLMDPPAGPGRLIEVIGDSISCGYGTLGASTDSSSSCFLTETHWDAFPSVMARALGAEVSTIGVSGRGVYKNFGGDLTGTVPMVYANVLTNLPVPVWDFHIQPQAVVINLGTNDISGSGGGDPGMMFQVDYQMLVDNIRAHYPNAYILCTIGPLTNTAQSGVILGYARNVVDGLKAAGDTKIEVFDQIAPQAMSMWACSSHPNVAEQAIVGNQLADRLRTVLGW